MTDQTPLPSAEKELHALENARVIPGPRMVLAMFLFAASVVGLMYVYWHLYTLPFRPLQATIAQEFPGSGPQVVGGRHKSHLPGNPLILRLVVRIDWDPRDDEIRALQTANRLAELSRELLSTGGYERLEIFLMHRRPEQSSITWGLDAPVTALPLPLEGSLPEGATIELDEGVKGT